MLGSDLLVGSHPSSALGNFYGPHLHFPHFPYSLPMSCEGSTAHRVETERAVNVCSKGLSPAEQTGTSMRREHSHGTRAFWGYTNSSPALPPSSPNSQ